MNEFLGQEDGASLFPWAGVSVSLDLAVVYTLSSETANLIQCFPHSESHLRTRLNLRKAVKESLVYSYSDLSLAPEVETVLQNQTLLLGSDADSG